MSMTIPVVPALPAGYVVQLADMQALAYAATFLLTKPVTRVRDTSGGVAIGTSATAVTFSVADVDTDGMWSVSAPSRLTVQTPGCYRVRYSVNCGSAVATAVTSWVIATTGPNNPAGAGIVSSPYWAGYADAVSGASGARPGAAGVWPFPLYAGDYLAVQVQAGVTGLSTAVTAPSSVGQGGSWFSLELVSI